ncbi:MAG: hypothetical protein M3Y41_21170, partial [Pseudomonadota bacterium]|nr:hypothetical protein [Pseudomonadota bacterium]
MREQLSAPGRVLTARLIHDVGGLAGALSGALELAREEQRPGEALSTASDAAEELGRRIRLLRAAWGPAGETLDLARLRELAGGAPGMHRMRLDLDGLRGATVFAAGMAQVLLNLVLLAADSLPRGG